MKVKNLVFCGAMASILMMGAASATEISMDDVKVSLNKSVVTEPAPAEEDYDFTFADGNTKTLADGITTADFDNYVAGSAAEENENITLSEGKEVKLGNTMAAGDYKYASKDKDGNLTMVAGDTTVTDLSKTYESSYGNITVSTADANVGANIANYKETGEGDVVYYLVKDGETYKLYNNGVDVTEAFPGKLATLKEAYETDDAAVKALKSELDGYKAFNSENHDAVADAVVADNATITGIATNKTGFEAQQTQFTDDTTAYNDKVAAYDDSLGKIVDTKVATGSIKAVVENAKMQEVTEPAPAAEDYDFTFADGETKTLADGITETDFNNYVAGSAAEENENITLSEGKEVKLGNTMAAGDYKYASKDKDGNLTMVAGDTAVTDLSKTYESSYGNITVSTADANVGANIANYTSGDYSLHINEETGEIELYQNGSIELDSPEMLATLKGAYEADDAAVKALKSELDGYKAFNSENHDAVADAVVADNGTIAGIQAKKDVFGAQQTQFDADTTAYNDKVAAYDNSLGKVINDKDAATLASAKSYADGLAVNYDAAGAAETAEQNAKDYADELASNYDASGAAEAAKQAANSYTDGKVDAEKTAREEADAALQTDIDNEIARATAAEEAIRGEFAAADARTLANANAYTDKKVDTLEKNVSGGIAAATALSAVNVSNVGKGEVSVGGGYGYYNSQSAVALGAAMGLSDRWSVNAGAGIATGDKTQVSFRAGTNYKFKLF